MKWIPVKAGEGQAEYVNPDKVVSIQFANATVAMLRVIGGGEKLITIGEVDDPDTLESLRQMVGIGEGPVALPAAEAVARDS